MRDPFPILEPPSGGLARLQSRLANDRPRRRVLWVTAPALAGVPALLVIVVRMWFVPAVRPPPWAPVTAIAGSVHPPVLTRLLSSNERVILYAVAATWDLDASR